MSAIDYAGFLHFIIVQLSFSNINKVFIFSLSKRKNCSNANTVISVWKSNPYGLDFTKHRKAFRAIHAVFHHAISGNMFINESTFYSSIEIG